MCNLSVIKVMAAIVPKVTLSLITRNHLVSFSCFSFVLRPVDSLDRYHKKRGVKISSVFT